MRAGLVSEDQAGSRPGAVAVGLPATEAGYALVNQFVAAPQLVPDSARLPRDPPERRFIVGSEELLDAPPAIGVDLDQPIGKHASRLAHRAVS